MAAEPLTPQEYGLHLKQLREDLVAHLERGEGKFEELRRRAEAVLALREQYPGVYHYFRDIEGLAADMLARQRQRQFATLGAPPQAPGCALGWLRRRR